MVLLTDGAGTHNVLSPLTPSASASSLPLQHVAAEGAMRVGGGGGGVSTGEVGQGE